MFTLCFFLNTYLNNDSNIILFALKQLKVHLARVMMHRKYTPEIQKLMAAILELNMVAKPNYLQLEEQSI